MENIVGSELGAAPAAGGHDEHAMTIAEINELKS